MPCDRLLLSRVSGRLAGEFAGVRMQPRVRLPLALRVASQTVPRGRRRRRALRAARVPASSTFTSGGGDRRDMPPGRAPAPAIGQPLLIAALAATSVDRQTRLAATFVRSPEDKQQGDGVDA